MTVTENENVEFTGMLLDEIGQYDVSQVAVANEYLEAPPSYREELDEDGYGSTGAMARAGVAFPSGASIRPAAARNLARETRPNDSWVRRYHFGNKSVTEVGDSLLNFIMQNGLLTGPGLATMVNTGDGSFRSMTLEESLARAAQQPGAGDLLTPSQNNERPSLMQFGENEWDDMKSYLMTHWGDEPELRSLVETQLSSQGQDVESLMAAYNSATTKEAQDAAANAMELAGMLDSTGRFLAPTQREMQARLDNRIIPSIIDEYVEELRSNASTALIGDVTTVGEGDTSTSDQTGWVISYDGSPYQIESVHELFGYGTFGPLDSIEYMNKLASGEIIGGPAVFASLQKELYSLGYLEDPSGSITDGDIRNAAAYALGHLQIDMFNMAASTSELDPEVLRSNIISNRIEELTRNRGVAEQEISTETADRIGANVVERLTSMGYNTDDMSLGGLEKLTAEVNKAVTGAQKESEIPGIEESDTRLARLLLEDFYQTDLVDPIVGPRHWTTQLSWMDQNTNAAFVNAAFESGALSAEREQELSQMTIPKWRNSLSEAELESIAVSNLVNSFSGAARSMSEDDISNSLMQFAGLMGHRQMTQQDYSTQDYSLMARNARDVIQAEVPEPDYGDMAEGVVSSLGLKDLGNPLMSTAINAIKGRMGQAQTVQRSRIRNV